MDPTVLAWHSPSPPAPVMPMHGAIFVATTGPADGGYDGTAAGALKAGHRGLESHQPPGHLSADGPGPSDADPPSGGGVMSNLPMRRRRTME